VATIDSMRVSKLLSLILRHRPDEFGLKMDQYGYVPLEEIIEAIGERYGETDNERIQQLIKQSLQHRFIITDKGIKALYGHSFFVEMDGDPMDPLPEHLYMGSTVNEARNSRQTGIKSGDRFYVHLSLTKDVAERRSKEQETPCVVEVNALQAQQAGHLFYARGEVVLCESLPAEFVGQIHGLPGDDNAATMGSSAKASAFGRRPKKATGHR
jgi:putative RNA 2'-phosphotransferase